MRTPSDLPPAAKPASHRGRRWIIVAAVLLVVVLVFAPHLRRLLHRRAVVLLGPAALGLAEALRGQGRPDAGVQRHLRRAAAGQPARGRAARPQGPLDGRRGRVRQALPGGHRALRPLAAGRRGGGAVADRRLPGARPVAELDPVPQQHAVRRHRPAVPPQRRLLRVHPAVPAVRRSTGPWSPWSWSCWSPRSATT